MLDSVGWRQDAGAKGGSQHQLLFHMDRRSITKVRTFEGVELHEVKRAYLQPLSSSKDSKSLFHPVGPDRLCETSESETGD